MLFAIEYVTIRFGAWEHDVQRTIVRVPEHVARAHVEVRTPILRNGRRVGEEVEAAVCCPYGEEAALYETAWRAL